MKTSRTVSGMALGAMPALTVTGNSAHAQVRPDFQKACSNATLSGAWGFHVGARVIPAGTPLAVIGRQVFDGKGSWSLVDVVNKIGWPGTADTYRVDIRVPDGTTRGMAALRLKAAFVPGREVSIPIQ